MASSSNDWYFTKEQLENTPSKQCGVESYKELSYRQQAANFIQDMGQKLKVSQLCINTAIVYMHRFYVFHSFTRFPWNSIAAAALFLAAKVEEQPRKLEHVIRVVNLCKNPHDTSFDTTSERYLAQSQDLVFNENILLQTLGFDVAIDHPHTHVVRCCHLVRASKDLAQTSYFMASNREWRELAHQLVKLPSEQSGSAKGFFLEAYSVATKSLHLTTMCLQYKPTVVACFCIHFVCKWSNWEIPLSNEKKEWFSYVDETVTSELLEQLTKEFLFIYDRCPSRLKEKIMAIGDGLSLNHNSSHPSSPFEPDKKFGPFPTAEQIQKNPHGHRAHHEDAKIVSAERPLRLPHEPGSSGQHRDREREYREKKDRERMGHHIKPPPPNAPSNKHAPPPHGHHGHVPPVDPKLNKHARPPSVGHPSNARIEPRDILREATRDIGLRDYKEPSREVVNKEALPSREINQQVRDKRDYMHQRQEVKPVGAMDSNSVTNMNYNSDKRVDANRPRPIDPKLQARRREEVKPYNKLESDIKKHLSAAIHDKNSLLHKPVNSTSQKIKSPFASEMPKAVPNHSVSQPSTTTTMKSEIKPEPHNGSNSNGSTFNLPIIESDIKAKFEASTQEEPVVIPVNAVKKPSLFSPEKSPPPQKKPKTKTPPSSGKKSTEIPIATILPTSPIFELPQNSANTKRSRTSSTNSEPELRPVMKKIDQVQGFENIMRDSSIGIKLHQVPDIITPISDVKQEKVNIQSSIAKELKPPDLIPPFNTNSTNSNAPLTQPIMNGIETNPSLISSLLKETPTVPHLPTVAVTTPVVAEPKEREHHKEHKKSKKEKHKHKDKEKSREEKEKKKKHKDKDREKHKHKHEKREEGNGEVPAQPIKITIPRDKIIQPPAENPPPPSLGVKIKIPKDRIKTDGIGESSSIGSGLKIKISKDMIGNFSGDNSSSKKRERDKSSPSGGPPNKISKSNHNRMNDVKSSKNSYNKVSNLNNNNVNETAMHNVQTSMYNGVNHMTHPVYANQNAAHNYFYNYPPPNMQMSVVPTGMNVPPPYMYQQFYTPGYMYPSAGMYSASAASLSGEVPPPLPQDPPPNNPPPPPPDF